MRQLGLCGAVATRSLPSPSATLIRRAKRICTRRCFCCCGALSTPTRGYFWPYNEDFVPKGAATSGFQSSASPSVRRRVLQEYALSPLFGARVPCCTLGTLRPAREVVGVKRDIQLLLCALMQLQAGSVVLGPLRQTTAMMLYKPGTPLSPRLGDDRSSNTHTYGRKPIAARTLMDVFLPEEIALDDVVALGRLVQEALQMALRERANSTTSTSTGMDQARVLVNRMNITHCEVPPLDEGGFVFDAMGGATIDADEAERIVQRWQERGGD